MFCKGALLLSALAVFTIHNAASLPIGLQSPINNFSAYSQQIMPSSAPVITEIVPALQFGDITVSGDLPIGGSIRVKGCFPVYGTVAVEGGLPSAGTAVVNTGGGVMAQLI